MCPESASRRAGLRSAQVLVGNGGEKNNQTLFVSLLCSSCPESLPQTDSTVIALIICGVLVVLVLAAVVACVVMRMLHTRHEYEG